MTEARASAAASAGLFFRAAGSGIGRGGEVRPQGGSAPGAGRGEWGKILLLSPPPTKELKETK